jgi:hypothetical protein
VTFKRSQGRAMAQAVSRRPPTAEARVRSRVSPCGICGGQSGTRTDFPPRTSVFSCQFDYTGASLHGKTKKLIIFITGLHNKPQGCGASVASAAGLFIKKQSHTKIPFISNWHVAKSKFTVFFVTITDLK